MLYKGRVRWERVTHQMRSYFLLFALTLVASQLHESYKPYQPLGKVKLVKIV